MKVAIAAVCAIALLAACSSTSGGSGSTTITYGTPATYAAALAGCTDASPVVANDGIKDDEIECTLGDVLVLFETFPNATEAAKNVALAAVDGRQRSEYWSAWNTGWVAGVEDQTLLGQSRATAEAIAAAIGGHVFHHVP